MITEDMIARALQAQAGMKLVHLTGITIPKDVRKLVNVNILKKYQCIPFELDHTIPMSFILPWQILWI